jgi:acetyltransferase-like isoleucine patch superfamily enzyme
MPKVFFGGNKKLSIGKFCSIADNVSIMLCAEHNVDWVTTYPFNYLLPSFAFIQGHPFSKGDITIGNDVWIGSDAKIMSGVHIGDGAIIAANALVTKNVEPYSIWGGVPAKFIKKRFSDEIIAKLLKLQWWNFPYEKLVEIIPILQSGNIQDLLGNCICDI